MKLVLSLLSIVSFAVSANANNMFYKTQFAFKAASVARSSKLADGGKVLYYGGPVISNVKVYAVFWTPNVDQSVQQNIGGFYNSLAGSTHMDWLSEYNTTNIKAVDGRAGTNQTIGRGSYGGEYVITPKNTKNDLQDEEIQAELEAQIAAQVLPAPDENSLYMIYFPAGISITIAGQSSCSSFCAYHNGFQSSKMGSVYYGIMPDLKSGMCSFGCGFGQDAFTSNSIISSHEFFEAVSDAFPTPGDQPAYPQAWNTDKGEEIGDVCANTSGDLHTPKTTYKIQGEWDNNTNTCLNGPYQSDK